MDQRLYDDSYYVHLWTKKMEALLVVLRSDEQWIQYSSQSKVNTEESCKHPVDSRKLIMYETIHWKSVSK